MGGPLVARDAAACLAQARVDGRPVRDGGPEPAPPLPASLVVLDPLDSLASVLRLVDVGFPASAVVCAGPTLEEPAPMSDDIAPPFGHHRCRVCKQILPLDAFYPSSLRRKVYVCKPCDRDVRAARRRTGRYRERDQARQRAWRARQREGRDRPAGAELCIFCWEWIAPHGTGPHEARHARERAA